MAESPIQFHRKPPVADYAPAIEPATCTEAEPYALRVLDDSMQPEFRRGCIIVIDPTGRATDGSYVLAKNSDGVEPNGNAYLFRQLQKSDAGKWELQALNTDYAVVRTADDLSDIEGVIVQRAGLRRSYHKRYD